MNEYFCSRPIWDVNVSWYAEVPDFTYCFQQVVFTLLPYSFFCICAVFHILYICQSRPKIRLPWTVLSVTRLAACFGLLAISAVHLAITLHQKFTQPSIPDILLCSNAARVVLYVLISVVLLCHRTRGVKSSTFLFSFWLVLSICCSAIYRSFFLQVMYQDVIFESPFEFVVNMLYSPLIYCEFVFACFTDAKHYVAIQRESPLEEESVFSLLTFGYINSLIMQSRRKLLTVVDFLPLSPSLQCQKSWEIFNEKWMEQSAHQMFSHNQLTEVKTVSVILKSFWPYIVASIVSELAYDVVRIIPPLLLDLLIEFTDNEKEYSWRGYLYCALLFVAVFITNYMYGATLFYPTLVSLQLKASFISAIYRKSLCTSSSAKRNYTSGEVVNLMSVDVEKIFDFFLLFNLLIGAPFRILVTIFILWQYLGLSCLAGVASIALMIPLSAGIAKINNFLQVKQMEKKDHRLKLLSELLNGIKLLKLFAWEEPFLHKVSEIRDKEVKNIRDFYFSYTGSSFLWGCSPFLISVASFATYVSIDKGNILYPSTAFVSLTLITMIKGTLFLFPEILSKAVQTNVSLNRLQRFLTSEEYDTSCVGESPDEGDAVTIRDATLSWDVKEGAVLKDLNLHVRKGKLVAVIGLVGAGKSSLLSSLVGIMHKTKGSIDVQGKIAYVPQEAWIQNKTVQENILFMKEMDKKLYHKVLDSCCLKPDLRILPAHDQTEIGEKGVNLSGGQKQRISIARAIYQCADVYLMDDPLSAVDTHVGKHIFDNVIGCNGMLKDKTRIIVTHSLSILPEVDVIVTIKNGVIEEIGTFSNLIRHDGPFAEFIGKHSTPGQIPDQKEEDLPIVVSSEDVASLSSHYLSFTDLRSSLSAVPGAKIVEEEQMEVGKVKRSVYVNYISHAGVPVVLAAIFGYVGYQAFEIGANIWVSEWSNDPVLSVDSEREELKNFRIGIYAVLGLGQAILVVCSTGFMSIASANASKRYHKQMLGAITRAPMSFFDTTPLGRVMNRFSKDIDRVDNEMLYQIDGWFASFCVVVGTFIIIAMATPEFLVALIPIAIMFYYVQKLYLVASRQLIRLETTTRSPIISHFAETIQGVSCIKAYNVESKFIDILEKRTDTNINSYFCWSSCNRWLSFRLDVISSFIVLASAVLCVYHKSNLDGALVGLSLNYALMVTFSLAWVVRTGAEIENKIVSIERIDEYSNIVPEAPWYIPETKPADTWPEQGAVTFQKYGTKYREGLSLVLQDLNLTICAGEKIGIVGRTGAGKSSLTLALFRIIEPTQGTIFIDGVDVSKIGLHDLRSKLTIIPQDPVLFSGSLRYNLDPNDEYSDEEIWYCLENAHLKSCVSKLSGGLLHNIAEGGENFSVGQRQLICFARALLRKTRILVLDEATASVDVETDGLIQETINSTFQQYTVITIAHRLNTIIDYNRVAVMEGGNVIEMGTPAELLENPESRFYQMAKSAGIV